MKSLFLRVCFSVRAGGDQAAGEPAEDPRVCPCEGQLEADAGL